MSTERLRELASVLPCGSLFDARVRCLAPEAHPVHHGKWFGVEPNHEFQPFDRRSSDRRLNANPTRDVVDAAVAWHEVWVATAPVGSPSATDRAVESVEDRLDDAVDAYLASVPEPEK